MTKKAMWKNDEDIRTLSPVVFALERMSEEYRNLLYLSWNSFCSPQGFRIYKCKSRIKVEASDPAGMMYGILEVGERVECEFPEETWIEVTPAIENRGIKFNIPLDARTPSYSDASDSAFENITHVWEWDFWTEFLDEMALHRFNLLSLWSLSPFPSLVEIPEYPDLGLADVKRSVIFPRPAMSGARMYAPDMTTGLYTVKKMSIKEKIAFWKRVMEYAQERCVSVYLFLWNLFVFGTEGNEYGITCDQNNPVTADYLYCAVKALLHTYPLLRGLGITAGENMAGDKTDISFLRETCGRAVEECLKEEPERKFVYIHRMQYARFGEIETWYEDYEGDFAISFKYSQAHMYSYVKPGFFQKFREEYSSDKTFWFTLRDDDFYLYRWGDIPYAREYVRHMLINHAEGFYLGADGFTWGRDYTSRKDEEHPLYIVKNWFKFDIWGQLFFNPEYSDILFCNKLEKTLEISDGFGFARLWSAASGIFSKLHCVHWHDYDFQWYPEGCCMFLHPPVAKLVFADIREFMNCPSMPQTPYLSVKEYAEQEENGIKAGQISPLQVIDDIRQQTEYVRKGMESEWTCLGDRTEEYQRIWQDIKLLGLLGNYYADKLEAALCLCRLEKNPSLNQEGQKAIELLSQACQKWKKYSEYSSALYRPQRLSRLRSYVDFKMFDRAAELDIALAEDFVKLIEERG